MADDQDAGIDKQRILAEIGASSALSEAPEGGAPAPVAAPTGDPVPPPVSLPSRPASSGRLFRHRRQIATMALVFVSLLWMSVGVAIRERAPFAFGGAFLGLAILALVGPLLRDR